MKLWPILGFVVVVSSLELTEGTWDKPDTSKALSCYLCRGGEDPFCSQPVKVECHVGEVCYEIHLKSIGVAMGCSKLAPGQSQSEYCHRFDKQFEPFISRCRDCSSDLCNKSTANTLMVAKLLYLLVIVGELMNGHLFA